ncbi:MAG: DUF4406 domain-containing protein [Atopobiaceae bacterium]
MQYRNQEGYADPTCFFTLSAIEQTHARPFRPLVYVCSPYAGDVEGNVAAVRCYCRFAVDAGCIPLAPHLLFPQFLDDTNPEERALGLFFSNVFMGKCMEAWVFGGRISQGMEAEITRARRKGQKIRYFTEEPKEVLKHV